MPLTVLPLAEAHIPAFCQLSAHSFRDSGDSNNRFLFPNPPSPERQETTVKTMRDAFHNTRNIVFLGVYETPVDAPTPESSSALSTDTLVCGARLRLEDPQTHAEAGKHREAPPDANQEAFTAFFGLIGGVRKETMGPKTYWNLDLLNTATAHQGRGAGSLVLKWMTDRAANTKAEETGRTGVECFLEGTKMGKPLYEKKGFVTHRYISLKGSDYGADADMELWAMIRPAERRDVVDGV